MQIRKHDNNAFKNAYDIWCNGIFSHGENNLANPFSLTECRIDPKGQSTRHQHDDQEVFIIKSGKGIMTIADEERPVAAGDAIIIPRNTAHTLKNSSEHEALVFYSISWLGPKMPKAHSYSLVIPAPPTPNGALHLGHLSGPYLSADVYCRYQRLHGATSELFMGTDDNQCYITNKARDLGIGNNNVLQKFKPLIKHGLEQFSIVADEFIEPENNEDYTAFIKHFFDTLVQKKHLVVREAPTVYCNVAHKFIYGADVQGFCPNCQKPTGGHGCENCGHYNDCHDLHDARSVFGTLSISRVNKERFYFPLHEHREVVSTFIESCDMHPRLKEFYRDYLPHLPDVSASQFSQWGIDAPLSGQKIYEWIEMAGAYTYYLKRAQKKFDCSLYELKLVETFGFDNSFFYGLLIPALIHAYDENLPKPRAFLGNYFYLLNREKFSTSRNHAIWAHDFLTEHNACFVRFYLSLTRGESGPTNFSLAEYQDFVTKIILGHWHDFFYALNDAIVENDNRWTKIQRLVGYQERFFEDGKRLLWQIHEHFDETRFSLNHACRNILAFMEHISSFYDRYRYTKKDFSTNLSLMLSSVNAWAYALAPLMPSFSSVLLKNFPESHDKFLSLNTHFDTISPFDLAGFSVRNTIAK